MHILAISQCKDDDAASGITKRPVRIRAHELIVKRAFATGWN